jgi:uncharacterized protein (DUF1697 family)
MAVFIALLRAVNVGGTGKIAMSELCQLCTDAGFQNVTTYIQSGNVVFSSGLTAGKVTRRLEAALREKMGKPVGVLLRTPSELEAILQRNPFKTAAPNRLIVLFFDRTVRGNELANLEIPGREEVEPSGREVFVHYPDGMGRSKLKIPHVETATGRNLNTVRKLLELSRATPAS